MEHFSVFLPILKSLVVTLWVKKFYSGHEMFWFYGREATQMRKPRGDYIERDKNRNRQTHTKRKPNVQRESQNQNLKYGTKDAYTCLALHSKNQRCTHMPAPEY